MKKRSIPAVKSMLYIDQPIHEALERICEQEDRTFTAQINRILREWLQQQDETTKITPYRRGVG